jgi:hypothetical protein
MAIVTTSQNLTAVSYTAGEIIEIRNGATLTIDSTPATRPGTIQCITSGKLLIENSSTTTPIVLELEDNTRDLRFEGNGVLEIRGAPMEIGTSDGTQQTWDFSTLYSGALTDITYAEVETASGSGEYMPWFIANITPEFYRAAFPLANTGATETTVFDAQMEVLFWNSFTRTLSSGDGTNGKLIPNGCKIRIPNILITNQDWQPDVYLAHGIASLGTPTGGTFTITCINRRTGTTIGTTIALAHNAAATTIRDAVRTVLGASTVNSSGGPLPTAVVLTLAGAYASTPIAMVVNSSVTGGTNSVIFSREGAVGNMSLLDLNPSGTIDSEWASFSQKFNTLNASFSNVKLHNTGMGGYIFSFSNSNGGVDLNSVSYTSHPAAALAANVVSNASGETKIEKLVIANGMYGNVNIQILPKLVTCKDVRVLGWGTRTSTSAIYALSFITLPNVSIVRPVCVGGAMRFTNLTGNVIVEPKHSDTPRIQTTANPTDAFTNFNCIDLTFAYLGKYGTSACRDGVFNTDAASSNILVVGGSYNMTNNGSGVVNQHLGAGFLVKNFTLTNSRTAIQSFDAPTTFACTAMSGQKVLIGGGQATPPVLDSNQDGQYDLVGCALERLVAANVSVENFIGGNFMNYGLTPTTGHVSFFAFGSGQGMTLTGSAFTDQIGSVFLPTATDTATLTIPFAMHGVTAFQSEWPRLTGETANGASEVHRIVNDGGVTGGTFTLSIYDADNVLIGTTDNIAFNASTSTVDTAVEAVTGAGTVTVSGALSTGYLITFTGEVRRVTADGTNLTGGTKAGTCEALCSFTRTVAGERHDDLEFAVRVPGTSWPSYQLLTPTNLSGAIAALSGYDAGEAGLEMRLQVTAPTTSNFTRLQQVSILTDIDPSLYTVTDSFITFNGPNPTDVIRIRKLSDLGANPPINLYSFTGGGEHDLDVGANFGEEVFFVREDSAGTVLMRSLPETRILGYGNLGEVDLFYGAEVQLAQSSDVVAIREKVDAYLDATISSRLAAAGYTVPPTASAIRTEIDTNSTKLDVAVSSRNAIAPDNLGIAAIKAKTDNLPASPAATGDIPSAATNATAVRSELATELGRIDVATSTRLAASAYTAPPTASAIRTEIDTNSTKLDVAVGTRLATSGYTAPPTVSAIRTEIDTNSTKLDVATSTRLAASAYTAAPTASANATAVRSELATELGRIDVAVSSRNATAPDNAGIAAIKAKTDNLPASPAAVSDIPTASANATAVRSELSTELGRIDVATSTRLATSGYTVPPTASAIRTEIDTNSTKLDVATSTRLAASAYTAAPTASANATAVRSELTTELGRIDVATSTRLAASAYSAAPTASAIRTEIDTNSTQLAAIKAKTDALPTSPAAAGDVPTASQVASQVRTELSTELGRIDVATSTRLATSGYTTPPSAATNATAVRSELSTELGRIDVATSTRLATSGYTTPPTASAIRTEIDTNSTQLSAIKAKTDGLTTNPASEEKVQEALDAAKLAAALSA